jgi:hypothetical protein
VCERERERDVLTPVFKLPVRQEGRREGSEGGGEGKEEGIK